MTDPNDKTPPPLPPDESKPPTSPSVDETPEEPAGDRPDGDPRESRRVLRWVIPLAIMLIGAAFVAVAVMLPGGRAEPKSVPRPPTPVVTRVIEPIGEFADTFTLPGVVEPNRVVQVAAEVAGRVEKIHIAEGERCRTGDALISLNTDLLQAEFDRARAQARYDRREYERLLELSERGVASESELDAALARAQTNEAALALTEAQLRRATIHAPIGGLLNETPVEAGEYVQPGQMVAEIVDNDPVKIIVWAPEADVHMLEIAQPARVVFDGLESQERTGRITFIGELAHPQTRTTRVEITVENPDRLFRSGQSVRVELTRRVLRDVIMVPLDAIIPLERGYVAYVMTEGRAEARRITRGLLRGRSVRITSGLSAGDRLILTPREVGPGQAVREGAAPADAETSDEPDELADSPPLVGESPQ